MKSLYVGIDVGTSGCRAMIINEEKKIVAKASIALPPSTLKNGHLVQKPHDWWLACHLILDNILSQVNRVQVRAICIDGTSGTVLLCDSDGTVLSDAYMYNDDNNSKEAAQIKKVAPADCAVHGVHSGLAKCLALVKKHKPKNSVKCLNQADWIVGMLTQQYNFSDHNNSLKLGYDVVNQQWPEWLEQLNVKQYLVKNVYAPGEVFTSLSVQMASMFELSKTTQIIAGTTDSIAAFIATGCDKPGDAVTSLGSTLAVKLISDKAIYSAEHGVYSHKLGDIWLVGGGSNTGGAVVSNFFNDEQISAMTVQLRPEELTGLDYYPLLRKGERFPINDKDLSPKLTPRPENDVKFFQGILEGISTVEKTAYEKLVELGAPRPTQIHTMGGGSTNSAWQKIRQQTLGVNICKAAVTEAAYGSALLAKQGIQQ